MRVSRSRRNRRTSEGIEMETPVSQQAEASATFFGTPPEPIFNESKNGVAPALLQESLEILGAKNEAAISRKEDDGTNGCFLTGNPAVFLFELSAHFRLRPEVKYWALELFRRFMVEHIRELYTHVSSSQSDASGASGSSPIKWSEVENRLKHQLPLRLVTCVQLASKLGSHYSIVSVSKARNFLTACGFRYATNSIVQSEIRVLKTLGFKVHYPTPVEFMEILLETLGHNDGSIAVKQIHGVALKVLNVFYLARNRILTKLMKVAGRGVEVAAVGADLMLLACAVIAAAAFILDQSRSDDVMKQLSQITCIVEPDILNFASVLLEEVMSDE